MNGDDAISAENLGKLYRSVGSLLTAKHAEDAPLAGLLEWAREQNTIGLAEELVYNLPNLRKVLAGKIRPKRLTARMFKLRERLGRKDATLDFRIDE